MSKNSKLTNDCRYLFVQIKFTMDKRTTKKKKKKRAIRQCRRGLYRLTDWTSWSWLWSLPHSFCYVFFITK